MDTDDDNDGIPDVEDDDDDGDGIPDNEDGDDSLVRRQLLKYIANLK